MRESTALIILLFAACLETAGDALVRSGIHASTSRLRMVFWLAGALMLFTYGYVVNAPPWDFGRLLGIYVVFFFLVAQILSWVVFNQKPDAFVIAGGCLVVLGGLVMSVGRAATLR